VKLREAAVTDRFTTNHQHLEASMSEIREANIEFKKQLSVKWVKGPSGHTYLCPVEALNRFNNPTEEQLKTICVDESANPQNN
jgi:hypothetical protein